MNEWTPLRKLPGDQMLHWRYVYDLTRDFQRAWLAEFGAYVLFLRGESNVNMLELAVKANDPDAALLRMNWPEVEIQLAEGVQPLLGQSYNRAANAELGRLKMDFRLDLENPYALRWAENHAAGLVKQVSEETKKALRGVIVDAYQKNIPPRRAAMQIRGMVGLTDRQAMAVMNYWRSLNEDATLSARRANELADGYAERKLRERALLIARTEIVASAAKGTQDSWAEARNRGLIDPLARQEWIAAIESGRTCPRCIDLDGQKVPIGQPFMEGGSPVSGPPLHPACRCAVGMTVEIPD